MVKISSLPACYCITKQVKAGFHQTFRVCLRNTEGLLGDPRRNLGDRQLSPKPLTVRNSERRVGLPVREVPAM